MGYLIELEPWGHLPEQSFYIDGCKVVAYTKENSDETIWEKAENLFVRGYNFNQSSLEDVESEPHEGRFPIFREGHSQRADPRRIRYIDEHFENPLK